MMNRSNPLRWLAALVLLSVLATGLAAPAVAQEEGEGALPTATAVAQGDVSIGDDSTAEIAQDPTATEEIATEPADTEEPKLPYQQNPPAESVMTREPESPREKALRRRKSPQPKPVS
jgi:hypothetical protein